MPNPYVMQGIAKGFQDATNTLLQVSLKKQGLERQKKIDDADFKLKKLQYDKLGVETGILQQQNKIKKAVYDLAFANMNKTEKDAKAQSEKLDAYSKGITDEYRTTAQQGGFELGGRQYDLMSGLSGELKEITPEATLKREKAIEELKFRREREGFRGKDIPGKLLQPVKPHQLIARAKPEFAAMNEPTAEKVKGIKTFSLKDFSHPI